MTWDCDDPSVGVARRTAYALSIFPLDIIQRSTVRAMLPVGRTKPLGVSGTVSSVRGHHGKGHKNITSMAYGAALQRFEQSSWIDRGHIFVRVRQRGMLLDYAMEGLAAMPAHFVHLDDAVQQLRQAMVGEEPDDQRYAMLQEQRRRELIALQQLMQSGVQGAHWSGRGSVRFVPKGRAL